MKLKDYAKKINELMNQGYEDLDIVYGADDEGNSFQHVTFNPSVGYMKGDYNGEFIQQCKENEEMWPEGKDPNAICIN